LDQALTLRASGGLERSPRRGNPGSAAQENSGVESPVLAFTRDAPILTSGASLILPPSHQRGPS